MCQYFQDQSSTDASMGFTNGKEIEKELPISSKIKQVQ